MDVLEKILEEIEKEQNSYEADHAWNYSKGLEYAKEIIRSHMVEKEKVSSAEIISRNIDGKPYYEIKFKKVGEDHYTVGYSSYKLDYVVNWLNEYFEFYGEVKASVNVAKDTNVPCNDEIEPASKEFLKDCAETAKKYRRESNGWIPVEDTEHTPEDESYVLVSFSNFSLPDIARYEKNDEGGTYYPGDDEDSYLKYGLFVNAWMPFPELYREDIKTNEGSDGDV